MPRRALSEVVRLAPLTGRCGSAVPALIVMVLYLVGALR